VETPSAGTTGAARPFVVVTADQTIVRESPLLSGKKIATAKKNQKYPLVETRTVGGKAWYQVVLSGETRGWIPGSSGRIAEK